MERESEAWTQERQVSAPLFVSGCRDWTADESKLASPEVRVTEQRLLSQTASQVCGMMHEEGEREIQP